MTKVPTQSPTGKHAHLLVLPLLAFLVVAAGAGIAVVNRKAARIAQDAPPPPTFEQALAKAEAEDAATQPPSTEAKAASAPSAHATPPAAIRHARLHPVVLAWMKPAYPKLALANRIQGDVDVSVRIDRHGLPESLAATGGGAVLQQAALDAARQWRFKPSGAPSDYLIHFDFKLA